MESKAACASGVSLDDKYLLRRGSIYLSGIQALVRLPLVQAARDAAAGLDTAGFISGYRGSPLAGLDQQLWRAQGQLDEHRIRFLPGLNEELAATSVWGSQQVGLHGRARHQGVFGMWYGKAPGLDRACDAMRHANAAGTAPNGGVLAICGDDHACKSSSYPSQSEYALMHLEIPILSPASVQDVLDFGLLGWALSRYSGCWVAMIALADVMDSSAVVRVAPERPEIALPGGFELPEGGLHIRLHDDPKEQERRLREFKIPAVLEFARANDLNRVVFDCPQPRLVIVTTGKSYADTRQALDDIGIDAAKARQIGLRLVKVGMPWPLDPVRLSEFCRGAERVLVVEEKRPVVEGQLKEILYSLPNGARPRVVGKRDDHGGVLLDATGDLDSVAIARAIALQLPAGVSTEPIDDYLARVSAGEVLSFDAPRQIERIPYFCSGCPHNRSTIVPEGSRALVGIGCHYMVQWMDRDSDSHSQMGGEGVAWLGQEEFSEEEHVFANLGDGTYLHSGILAIRAAVAAGSRITFKLLYNHAVAMTGGQPLDDILDVPRITRQLAAEGVEEIVVVAEEPERYRGQGVAGRAPEVKGGAGLAPGKTGGAGRAPGVEAEGALAPGVKVESRSRLEAVQRRLREYPGVSVLIYDQGCAAEKRRQRRRGEIEDPKQRVFINERVCEGCGDCSVVSNCLSVEPIETELGPKRRINQSSCNKDFSCLEGSCPALVLVKGGELRKKAPADLADLLTALPDPPQARCLDEGGVYNIVVAGIGGTGVTTAAALLGMAAHLEGRASGVLDMTGLAQKGGAVVSHVRIGREPESLHGTRVPSRSADLLLGCDSVVASSDAVLGSLHRRTTQSVINSHFAPTAASIGPGDALASESQLIERVRAGSRRLHSIDATRLCEEALGDAIGSNLFLLGHAYQRGLIPLGLDSIDRAIELNGVALEMNRLALGLGRLSAFDPKRLEDLFASVEDESEPGLDVFVSRRARDLSDYQDSDYAARYLELVDLVRSIETERIPGAERLSWAVARGAYKLMAYKDEYEVARLHTQPRPGGDAGESGFLERLSRELEGEIRVELQIAPPLFARRDKVSGRLMKRSVGPWFFAVMRLLARFKFLRGSVLDPFARLPERRLERRLAREYHATVRELVRGLDDRNHDLACRIAELPQKIRGFDRIKQASALAAGSEQDRLLEEFRVSPPPSFRTAR